MERTELLRGKYERLERTLAAAVSHFGGGRDNSGLDTFLAGLDDIEDIVQTCLCLGEYGPVGDLLPPVRRLQEAVRNADVVAVTDILEFTLLPLVQKALEGMPKE